MAAIVIPAIVIIVVGVAVVWAIIAGLIYIL